MKVNFVSEFNTFIRFARDNSLSLRERMLWIALFYVANDRKVYSDATQEYEWPDGFFQVSNGELNLYCCLDKRGIETLRNTLKQRGLIDFQPGQKNKKNPAYRMFYLTAQAEVGCKNAPNNTSNDVPNYASNSVPNYASNSVPNHAENGGEYGTNLHPTMPPYTQSKYIKQNQSKDRDRAEKQPERNGRHAQGDFGFVDLDHEEDFEGLVPLPREGARW